MTFNKMIVVSSIIGNLEGAVSGFLKSGRMTQASADAANARTVKFQEWLEGKDESYFPADACGNTDAFKAFEVKCVKDFLAQA